MFSLSIIVPAFNEEQSLSRVVQEVMHVLRSCGIDHEVLVLNDASTDGTGSVTAALEKQYPGIVHGYSHTENQGIYRTFEDLFSLATKDYVMEIPGDGQIDPEVIARILPLLDDYDMVVCRRSCKSYSFYRHLVSWAYGALPRLLFGIELVDPGCAKCRKRSILTDIPTISRSVFIEAERMIRAHLLHYRIGSINIVMRGRQGGKGSGGRLSTLLPAVRDMLWLWYLLRLRGKGSLLSR